MQVAEPSSGDSRGISLEVLDCPHAEGAISRNKIFMAPNHQGGAINVNNGNRELTVDVVANQISGQGHDDGVDVFQFAPGGQLRA